MKGLAALPAETAPPLRVRLATPELGPWRAGNTGLPGVWSFAAAEAGPHLALVSLMHGNEIAGGHLVARWLRDGLRPARGRLTLVLANLAAFDLFDPADPTASRFVDEDMNRLWAPAMLDGGRRSAELERARALRPVIEAADVLLDLHSMLWPSDPLLLVGPTRRARDLAQGIGTPGVVVADEGYAGGMRLIDVARFGRGDAAAMLLEAGPHWEEATVAQMERSAAGLLRRLGMAADGAPLPPEEALPPARFARVSRTVTAESTTFAFLRPWRGGEVVPRRNTLIALDGEQEIRTPHDDCLLVMPSPQTMRGHTAVRLARFEE